MSPLRFVLVSPWIAEVGQEPVAEVLGDVAAGSEDHVGTAPREDPAARERGMHGPNEGAGEIDPDPARNAGDLEGVELVARVRN